MTQRAGQPVARSGEATGPDTQALPPAIQAVPGTGEPEPSPAGTSQWARLIALSYAVDPLVCRHCGERMRLIAFTVDASAIARILEATGEPAVARRAAPIRDPPADKWPMVESPLAHDPIPSFGRAAATRPCRRSPWCPPRRPREPSTTRLAAHLLCDPAAFGPLAASRDPEHES